MTQKVEVAFGLAFIQLINVVSISSSSFSSFAMISPMELLGGKPAWQLFFIISNCVKAIVYEQMSNDRMNKEENKVFFAIHLAQGIVSLRFADQSKSNQPTDQPVIFQNEKNQIMKSNVWLRLVSRKMRKLFVFFLYQISGSTLIFNLDVKEFVFLSDVEVYIFML